jgi:hypothetical protein
MRPRIRQFSSLPVLVSAGVRASHSQPGAQVAAAPSFRPLMASGLARPRHVHASASRACHSRRHFWTRLYLPRRILARVSPTHLASTTSGSQRWAHRAPGRADAGTSSPFGLAPSGRARWWRITQPRAVPQHGGLQVGLIAFRPSLSGEGCQGAAKPSSPRVGRVASGEGDSSCTRHRATLGIDDLTGAPS